MSGWFSWFTRQLRSRPAPSIERRLRPVCPVCEKPMERRGSTVWMCPDFPRCPGSVAAAD